MASEVDIANTALMLLGEGRITSLSDASERAIVCNIRYPMVRDAVLRAHPWNCAVVRTNLAALATTPSHDFTSEYQLPTDPFCLRMLEVRDYDMRDWAIEGRKLLINDSGPIYVRYISRNEDPETYDPLLIEAIAARLAHAVAQKLIPDRAKQEHAWGAYQAMMSEARSIDGLEGAPPVVSATTFLDERY